MEFVLNSEQFITDLRCHNKSLIALFYKLIEFTGTVGGISSKVEKHDLLGMAFEWISWNLIVFWCVKSLNSHNRIAN